MRYDDEKVTILIAEEYGKLPIRQQLVEDHGLSGSTVTVDGLIANHVAVFDGYIWHLQDSDFLPAEGDVDPVVPPARR